MANKNSHIDDVFNYHRHAVSGLGYTFLASVVSLIAPLAIYEQWVDFGDNNLAVAVGVPALAVASFFGSVVYAFIASRDIERATNDYHR